MPTRGLKRKFPEFDESVLDGHLSFQTDSYPFFRQSLLNISLEKFNKGRAMIEPSLRRYVLIANTLRAIQEEICCENPCPFPATDAANPRTCDMVFGNDVVCLPQNMENTVGSSVEDDFTVTAAIASILRELESVLDESCPQGPTRTVGLHEPVAKMESQSFSGSLAHPSAQPPSNGVVTMKEDLFSLNPGSLVNSTEIALIKEMVLAASCSQDLPVAMDTSLIEEVPAEASTPSNLPETPIAMDTFTPKQVITEAPVEQIVPTVPTKEFKPSEAVFGSFEILNSSYLNGVSFDDPFSDIDTSVFEKESPLLGAAPINRLSSEDFWCPPSCNSTNYTSSHGIQNSNELDNIIEILVGS